MTMDHKTYLAGVAPELRETFTARVDAPGLWHLAGHLGVILGFGVWIGAGLPLWQGALVAQGIALCFLFTLAHECTHKTPFARGWLNEAAGHGVAVLILLPFRAFRYFHLAHHRWTNIAGRDPELEGSKPEGLRGWLCHVSGLPYWIAQARLVLTLALGRFRAPWLPEGARAGAQREARAMLVIYVAVALSLFVSPLLFWVWLLPVVLGQPFLRLYLLAEHGDCPHVANMFDNTRTTFTNRILRFLAWNMPYHTEHHVWPAVPFHQLPALHADMKAHLGVTANGYVAFNRAYLARRL